MGERDIIKVSLVHWFLTGVRFEGLGVVHEEGLGIHGHEIKEMMYYTERL